jgi:hypothetical protein
MDADSSNRDTTEVPIFYAHRGGKTHMDVCLRPYCLR